MFGFGKSEPSAEMLAGSGPSMTYPSPPSASASPEAIASIAGGTAVPDSTSPNPTAPSGFGTPSTQVASLNKNVTGAINSAAAKANGFGTAPTYASSTTPSATPSAPSSYSAPSYATSSSGSSTTPSMASANLASSGSAVPSGYRFGQTATPSMAATTTPAPPTQTGISSYALSSGSPPSAILPSNAVPGASVASTQTPSAPATPPSASAFTLPDAGSTSSIDVAVATPSPSATSTSTTPAYNTAASVPATSSPAAAAPSNSGVAPVSGYMPGSTSGATGYPSSGYPESNAGGSYYR